MCTCMMKQIILQHDEAIKWHLLNRGGLIEGVIALKTLTISLIYMPCKMVHAINYFCFIFLTTFHTEICVISILTLVSNCVYYLRM